MEPELTTESLFNNYQEFKPNRNSTIKISEFWSLNYHGLNTKIEN